VIGTDCIGSCIVLNLNITEYVIVYHNDEKAKIKSVEKTKTTK
jgi:hypothetical protein